MLCREFSLVKHGDGWGIAIPLLCRSWGCDYCNPIRKRQLVDLAKSGQPNRLVTITVSPAVGVSAADRAQRLAAAWRRVVQRWRRLNQTQELEYLAVFEATKRGEPHLHVLCRSGYIAQRWLSVQMRELLGSPIVDVRRIHSARHAALYVSKYVGKAPHHFATCKRYWQSKAYATPVADKTNALDGIGTPWSIVEKPLREIMHDWEKRHLPVHPYRPYCTLEEHWRITDEIYYGQPPNHA